MSHFSTLPLWPHPPTSRSWYCDQPPGSFVSLVGRLLVSWAPVLLVTIWMGMLLPMASYLLVKVWNVWTWCGI